MDNGAESYRRYRNGDDAGLAEMIDEYGDGLILYLNTYVHNLSVAEELAEDTFVRLVTRKPAYVERSSFKTWLYAIARNLAIDWLRREKKENPFPPRNGRRRRPKIPKSSRRCAGRRANAFCTKRCRGLNTSTARCFGFAILRSCRRRRSHRS